MSTFRNCRAALLLVGSCKFVSFGFSMGSTRSVGIRRGPVTHGNVRGNAICLVLYTSFGRVVQVWCRGACCVLRQALRVVRAETKVDGLPRAASLACAGFTSVFHAARVVEPCLH